jgi:hypothetical protein
VDDGVTHRIKLASGAIVHSGNYKGKIALIQDDGNDVDVEWTFRVIPALPVPLLLGCDLMTWLGAGKCGVP